MNNFLTSQIRTIVPTLVGSVVAWLIARGINIDAQTQAWLIATITGLAISVYYVVVRWLEQFVNAKFGWLLGAAKKPVYKAVK